MQYTANINWKRNDIPFNAKSFDRSHVVTFGGGSSINACSAPEYLGKAELVNPEELFTASISSCFMLTFLYWASVKGVTIDEYSCEAVGKLGKNSEGKIAMTEITLKPSLRLGEGVQADTALLDDLYKKAHEHCFISTSVKTTINIEAQPVMA